MEEPEPDAAPEVYLYKPKRKWTTEEEAKFLDALNRQPRHQSVTQICKAIAKKVYSKTFEQVRQKYYRAVQVRSEAPEEEPGHRPAKAASQKADKAAAGVPKKARKAPAAAVAEQQPACSEAAQQRTGVVAPTHAADQGPCAATAGCADNLRVQVAPRDNPTAVAVHKCREEVVVDTLLSPATSLPQLLQWLEQKRWPGAAQSLAGSLHLFPSQYIAGQTHGACWGPRSDATLTVGDLHSMLQRPPILCLEYGWLQLPEGGAATAAAAAGCSVSRVAPMQQGPPADRGGPPPAPAKQRAPVIRLRLPACLGGLGHQAAAQSPPEQARPVPDQARRVKKRKGSAALPDAAASQHVEAAATKQPSCAPLAASASARRGQGRQQAAAVPAAVHMDIDREQMDVDGWPDQAGEECAWDPPVDEGTGLEPAAGQPEPPAAPVAAPEEGDLPPKKRRRVQAAGAGAAAAAAQVAGQPATAASVAGFGVGMGHPASCLPSSSSSLFGVQTTCDAFQQAWGLEPLPAAAAPTPPQAPVSRALGSAPVAGTRHETAGPQLGECKDRGAAAAGLVAAPAAEQGGAQSAPSAPTNFSCIKQLAEEHRKEAAAQQGSGRGAAGVVQQGRTAEAELRRAAAAAAGGVAAPAAEQGAAQPASSAPTDFSCIKQLAEEHRKEAAAQQGSGLGAAGRAQQGRTAEAELRRAAAAAAGGVAAPAAEQGAAQPARSAPIDFSCIKQLAEEHRKAAAAQQGSGWGVVGRAQGRAAEAEPAPVGPPAAPKKAPRRIQAEAVQCDGRQSGSGPPQGTGWRGALGGVPLPPSQQSMDAGVADILAGERSCDALAWATGGVPTPAPTSFAGLRELVDGRPPLPGQAAGSAAQAAPTESPGAPGRPSHSQAPRPQNPAGEAARAAPPLLPNIFGEETMMGLFVKLHGPDAGSQPDHGPWAGDALTRDLLPSLSALAASQAALFSCS